MEAPRTDPAAATPPRVDWEAFYRGYRKPGYLAGFEIVNKLGGGMFGLVFKARKESIGKDYAIKFLKVDDDTVRDAVLREIDNVGYFAQIDHPNLVSIEDKGTVDGIPYLVMSYAGEETLQKRLATGRMSREDALRVFVQAARGVQALHDHSLVHFDLKPANIFLKGDVARVGDYGLSKLVSVSRNSLSFGRGTPYYMAPEMLQRRGDARSDVYSLGIILFECLYGDVPFRGDSEWEVLRKHEVAAPEFPPQAEPADRAVVLRCLQKKPEDRFPSVTELLRALQAPVALGESFVLRESRPANAAPSPICVGPQALRTLPPSPMSPPPLPRAAGDLRRDPADSPYGMPWQKEPARGLLAFLVRALFSVFELAIWLLMLPVRAVSVFAGRGIVWLLKLPLRILGLAAQLIGLLLVFALLVLVVAAVLGLIWAV
jgi:serine/threonine protein kinase